MKKVCSVSHESADSGPRESVRDVRDVNLQPPPNRAFSLQMQRDGFMCKMSFRPRY